MQKDEAGAKFWRERERERERERGGACCVSILVRMSSARVSVENELELGVRRKGKTRGYYKREIFIFLIIIMNEGVS